MLTTDLTDLAIEVFGGYTPSIAPSVIPAGASPSTQDCYFPEGAVATRGGLLAIFGPGNGIPNTATINGLKTYLTPTIDHRLMVWDSAGNMYKESPDGTLNLFAQRPQGANTLYQSSTLFGREYQAFFAYADPLLGLDIPRQYDDTNWDRVSQVGPGASPNVADSFVTANIVASPNGLFNQTGPYSGQTITAIDYDPITFQIIVTVAPGNFNGTLAGDSIIIAGVTNPAFDGTYTVLYGPMDGATLGGLWLSANLGGAAFNSSGGTIDTQIVKVVTSAAVTTSVNAFITIAASTNAAYDGTFQVRIIDSGTQFWVYIPTIAATANSGGGTITLMGHIAAGLHQVSLCFITRQGYITQAAPPNQWTATGNLGANVTNIATGPYNVVARLLLFTPVITAPATTGTFYSIPNGTPFVAFSAMLISDNTTTNTIVDFTDAILISSFQAEYLFTQIELGECASVNGYNARLVWGGERNKINNFINLTFDGGWSIGGGVGASDLPLGWTSGAAGGSRQTPPNSDWADR